MGLKNEGKKPAQPQWFNVILRLKTATDLNHLFLTHILKLRSLFPETSTLA